jgi:uridylate kinase
MAPRRLDAGRFFVRRWRDRDFANLKIEARDRLTAREADLLHGQSARNLLEIWLEIAARNSESAAERRMILPAGGAGNPFFTTETRAALREAELSRDAVMKAANVDSVYTADPKKDPVARRYDRLTHDDAIQRNLQVIDTAAFALTRDNKIPIVVFSVHEPGAIEAALLGRGRATYVTP